MKTIYIIYFIVFLIIILKDINSDYNKLCSLYNVKFYFSKNNYRFYNFILRNLFDMSSPYNAIVVI